MRLVKSCGVLCFRNRAAPEFLLMKHRHRYDLPKGHIEENETEEQCALRELQEETGLGSVVELIGGFRYETSYVTRYRRFNNQKVKKTLVIFAGWVPDDAEVNLSEHPDCEWVPWNPPHRIQDKTIDPLLAAAESLF
ncbi:MAG: NUDIX domain-containing protein [Verrucomicrobiota bacterium]